MQDRLSRVESSVRDLERALQSAEHRIAAVEAQLAIAVSASRQAHVDSGGHPEQDASHDVVPGHDLVGILALVGRTFVALGGAYLLRALTDSAILPHTAGIAAGLTYAAVWLVMADRVGASNPASSAFHALVASMIAFPLLWESVTRFGILGPSSSALGLALVTSAMFAIAARHRLQSLAWIAVVAALPTTLALISQTGSVLPFALFLIALGVATLWLGYTLEWVWLRWPVALVADATGIALVARVASRSWSDPPADIIAVQLCLLTAYLMSVVVRTLIRGRDVIGFEVVQSIAALAVGLGGAVYVAQATGYGTSALALVNLAIAIACYGLAFAFVARRQGLRRNFYFYTSLALVLALVSTRLLLGGAPLALTWATLGVASSWLANRTGRLALNLHAAVYVIAGASASGLMAMAAGGLAGSVTTTAELFSTTPLLALAALLVCWMIPLSPAVRAAGPRSLVPRFLISVALAWSAAGWLVGVLARELSPVGAVADPGVVATIRTIVLAAATLGAAWAGRHDRFRETASLVYPLLVVGGIKLLIEDVSQSKAATLFVALASYGGALIAAPRLSRPAAPQKRPAEPLTTRVASQPGQPLR